MKVFEILNLHTEILGFLQTVGIRVGDVRYIELYNEYRRLLGNGEKVTYIVASLSGRYHVSERKICGLVKLFQKDCSPYAV